MIPVSWLARYLYCPFQLYLEVVMGVQPVMEPRRLEGELVHSMISLFVKNEEKILKKVREDMARNEIVRFFYSEYLSIALSFLASENSRIKSLGLQSHGFFESHLGLISRLASKRGNEVFAALGESRAKGEPITRTLFPRIEASVFLESRQLGLKGEIDLVEIQRTSTYPVELKLSAPPKGGLWSSDRVQLGGYILLINKEWDSQMSQGFIEYLKTGERIRLSLNPFLEKEIFELRDRIEEMIVTKQPPKFDKKAVKCGTCGYRKVCDGSSQTLNITSNISVLDSNKVTKIQGGDYG